MEANSIFCSASFPGPIVHRPVLSHRGPNKRFLWLLISYLFVPPSPCYPAITIFFTGL
uniref:Uncharacterized protein n=1 Tax=Rhizophora mucronata TaxID=61149 RepID=A0A2P2K0M9_RHIMU